MLKTTLALAVLFLMSNYSQAQLLDSIAIDTVKTFSLNSALRQENPLKIYKLQLKKLKLDTAAFRIPDNKFCQLFLSKIKQPVISTSVNIVGTAPSNDYSEIKQKFFKSVSAIFFSKQKTEISQSTLIELTSGKPKLLRQGKINFVELMNIFG